MPYPALPGHRLAWDREADGFFFLASAPGASAMSEPQRQDLNNEQDAAALAQNAAGPVVAYVGVLFTELMNIDGLYIATSPGTNITDIETSTDTTDGKNGTWAVAESGAPVLGQDFTTTPSVGAQWRNEIATKNFNGIKAIRFKYPGGAIITYYALHLYGEPVATGERLSVWDPALDQRYSIAGLDFGDAPRRSSADLTFRVKNLGALVSNAVTLAVEDIVTPATGPDVNSQFLLSIDGRTFGPTASIGTLTPGQVSPLCYLRRVTPTNAALGLWALRLLASGTNKTDGVEYAWLGDVSTNVPTPHVWYIYPPTARIGEQVDIVGHGFGDNAAEYAGVARLSAAALVIDSWARVAASVDAYGVDRIISSVNDAVNVEHDRIRWTVPITAVDNPVTVETNA